jgi:tetratricopeptide (TPR) repeat protein
MKNTYKFLACLLTMALGNRAYAQTSSPAQAEVEVKLFEARTHFEQGNLEQAKELAEEVLKVRRNDQQAQLLMAEIIDEEIQADRQIDNKSASKKGNNALEIEKWLERSRSYLHLKQYDEAALAAEKVFLYDAYNSQASRLLDKIRNEAIREGKNAVQAMGQISDEEIESRIQNYRSQANTWIQKGRWGSAKLAVDKILWLHPYDREALKMQESIKTQLKNNEKRKAL